MWVCGWKRNDMFKRYIRQYKGNKFLISVTVDFRNFSKKMIKERTDKDINNKFQMTTKQRSKY